MRKFLVLLRKEVKELFTIQMIIPIILMAVMFLFLGTAIDDSFDGEHIEGVITGNVVILDNDYSELSQKTMEYLQAEGFNVFSKHKSENSEKLLKIEDADEIITDAILIIPEKFEENIMAGIPQRIDAYSKIKSLSITSYSNETMLASAIGIINSQISDSLISQNIDGAEPWFLKNPVVQSNHVILNDKTADISTTEIKSFLTTKNIFIPIVMFMIIIYSTQLLISSVASERENKTMETLLSTPVTRSAIVGAKMLAAGISALVYAVIYMFGFQYYMGALASEGNMSESLKNAVEQLGLTMGLGDYVLLGASLFVSILVALALASILGSMADDAKKAQSFITPVMLLVLIPYFLTMFVDLSTAQPLIKWIVNIIPFSHPFQASSYIFMKDYAPVILGILYQLVVFGVMLLIAAKIYSSDRIFITKHSTKKRLIKIFR